MSEALASQLPALGSKGEGGGCVKGGEGFEQGSLESPDDTGREYSIPQVLGRLLPRAAAPLGGSEPRLAGSIQPDRVVTLGQ